MKTNIKKSIFIIMALLSLGPLNILKGGEIHIASRNGDLEIVKQLVSNSPQLLNEKDNKGNTALHSAVSKGRNKVISYLLESGANHEIKNNNGLTPLFQALDLSKSESAKILIDGGANINIKGYRNRILLHMAARAGNTPITLKLISEGIDINAKDSKGSTALDCAIVASKTNIAKILQEHGGHINSFTPDNEECANALKNAIHRGQSEIFSIISDLGGDLKMIDESGINLLHKAAAYGWYEIINILLKSEININSKTKEGKTALQLAEEYGHNDIIELLKNKGALSTNSNYHLIGSESILLESLSENEAYI